jgi:lipopolysaccharide transport system permease protein
MQRLAMSDDLKRLVDSRELLWAWTGRNIKARYQQSVLGWLWAILQPAAQVAIFTVIFTLFVPVNTGKTPYILFSYAALAPWTFLSSAIMDMSTSIVGNMSLVTKIYFSREVLPVSAMLARLMDLGVATGLLIVIMAYVKVPPYPLGWLLLPFILITQILLVLGIGLASAAASVFYRDVQSVLSLVVQLWFYASPIIYPVSAVPERFRAAYFLNPMAGILEAYRDVLLYGRLPGTTFGVAFAISVCVFLVGYWFFKRTECVFADIV